jgi:hypothetical protein
MRTAGRFEHQRSSSKVILYSRTIAAVRALKGDLNHQRERGQALIEFALLMPFVLVLALLIVDLGIVLDRREVLQHSVREGARRGAVTTDAGDIIDTVVDQSQGILDPADVTVCYVDFDGNGSRGDQGDSVRVSAEYTHGLTFGSGELLAMLGIAEPAFDMTPFAEARLERSVSPAPAC